MPSETELADFIRATFRSVWTLELLLFVKKNSGSFGRAQFVNALRASDAIVANGTRTLLAAGLIVVEAEETATFRPASPDLHELVKGTEALYVQRPG